MQYNPRATRDRVRPYKSTGLSNLQIRMGQYGKNTATPINTGLLDTLTKFCHASEGIIHKLEENRPHRLWNDKVEQFCCENSSLLLREFDAPRNPVKGCRFGQVAGGRC